MSSSPRRRAFHVLVLLSVLLTLGALLSFGQADALSGQAEVIRDINQMSGGTTLTGIFEDAQRQGKIDNLRLLGIGCAIAAVVSAIGAFILKPERTD